MKILHVCLASFYIDGYSYQENLLPRYHKKMGFDVEILASKVSFDKNGNPCLLDLKGNKKYFNEDGILVTRLEYKKNIINKVLRRYCGVLEELERVKPDIIFIHGCQFLDILKIKKYLKECPNITIYIDNHADFSNSAKNFLSKNFLHGIVWKYCAKSLEKVTKKFYGVLPSRVEFLKNVYKVSSEKIHLLVMGVDDEKINSSINHKLDIRKKLGLNEDEFIIVTCGKIDNAKREVFSLIDAVKKINNSKVKLVIFGSIIEELKEKFEIEINDKKIKYLGWATEKESYDYFAMSDLVIFPGRHSVYWEQVVGMKIPLIIKYWIGTTHVDIGGNCKFLYKSNSEEIENILRNVLKDNKKEYFKMVKCANKKKSENFLYSKIANKSIDL